MNAIKGPGFAPISMAAVIKTMAKKMMPILFEIIEMVAAFFIIFASRVFKLLTAHFVKKKSDNKDNQCDNQFKPVIFYHT